MVKQEIPDIVIGRLPIYLRGLQYMKSEGKLTASSLELSAKVGLSATQIRKDLSQFGGFGKQGTGYDIPFLIDRLREILNMERTWAVAVVGMGDVGHALARYPGFRNSGFRVAMVFDNSPAKVGMQVGDFTIRDTSEIVAAIGDSGIRLAMLCVPASSAQAVTDLLVKAGIKAILNYAPINLSVPADVQVQYIDPSVGLQRMTYYLE
jgi:redox-sensing transcriptional repressor